MYVPWDGESDVATTPKTRSTIAWCRCRCSATIPLSDNPLTWTSIAYVLWDEVDPQVFTPEQERALVDWLHWGGQLVVSGPDSLDLLKGSFLEPYLPATSGGSRRSTAADLAELKRWLADWHARSSRRAAAPTAPWSGVALEAARPRRRRLGDGRATC